MRHLRIQHNLAVLLVYIGLLFSHQCFIKSLAVLNGNKVVRLAMNQERGAADLLHGVKIVKVLRNDHAEKSSDDVFRNFFDGQVSAD